MYAGTDRDATACAAFAILLGSSAGRRQKYWMEAVERRISKLVRDHIESAELTRAQAQPPACLVL
jgi:hypothetical protein